MLAQQALVDAGDEVLVLVPVWPNLTAQPAILGARVQTFSLTPGPHGWSLDLTGLLARITPATRVLVVNAPNNPTGWTFNRDEQAAILAHCRSTGTWIVSDEVYERLYYPADGAVGACAPSFLDLIEPDDRVIVVHSFSKSFLMTGLAPGQPHRACAADRTTGQADRVQYLLPRRSSCSVPAWPRWRIRPRTCRDCRRTCVCAGTPLRKPCRTCRGCSSVCRKGAMYLFLQVVGESDTLALAKRLVSEHGLGLAPGSAFGPEGEGWLRWCFASRDPSRLVQGADRLRRALRL